MNLEEIKNRGISIEERINEIENRLSSIAKSMFHEITPVDERKIEKEDVKHSGLLYDITTIQLRQQLSLSEIELLLYKIQDMIGESELNETKTKN